MRKEKNLRTRVVTGVQYSIILLYNTHGGDVYDCVTENLWNQNKIRRYQ